MASQAKNAARLSYARDADMMAMDKPWSNNVIPAKDSVDLDA